MAQYDYRYQAYIISSIYRYVTLPVYVLLPVSFGPLVVRPLLHP